MDKRTVWLDKFENQRFARYIHFRSKIAVAGSANRRRIAIASDRRWFAYESAWRVFRKKKRKDSGSLSRTE
jgi:hypothetical protein